MKKKASIAKSVLIYLIATSILFITFTKQIEYIVNDNYQYIMYLIAGGWFSNHIPSFNHYFLGYIGYAHLIQLLTSNMPNVNWMGTIEIALIIASYNIYFYTIFRIAQSFFNNFWWLLIVGIIGSISFLDVFSVISFTRPALLLCGLSIFNLLFFKDSFKKRLIFHALFIMGILLRPESALGMAMFLIGTFFFIYLKLKPIFIKLKFEILAMMVLYGIIFSMIRFTDNFLYNIEPEIEYKFMQGYVKKLPNDASIEDSIKYVAATHAFIFDPDILSADYLRSIQTDISVKDLILKFKNSDNQAFFFLMYPISLALFLLSVFFSIYKRKWRVIVSLCLITTFLMLLFFGLKINSGIENRHAHPFLLIYQLIVFFLFTKIFSYKQFANPLSWLLSAIFIILFVFIQNENIKQNTEYFKNEIEKATFRLTKVEETFNNQFIVFDLSSLGDFIEDRFALENHPLLMQNNQYMIFEAYNFSMTAKYNEYIKGLLGKENFSVVDVYEYFSRQNVLYLSTEKNMTIIKDYLRIIYGFEMMATDENIEFGLPKTDVRVYRLSL